MIVLDRRDKVVAVSTLGVPRAVSRARDDLNRARTRYCDNGAVKNYRAPRPYRESRTRRLIVFRVPVNELK